MSTSTAKPAVGFIGLGDQGLPMATAIAEAGYTLHVWARRPGSLHAALRGVGHVRHDDKRDLGASCDIVALCVGTDEGVTEIVTGGLLDGLRPGSVVVNHGTGTPRNAVRLTETCARGGVDVLDAPVSGGRPAAQAKTLTTMVGGPHAVAQACEPIFGSFSQHVVKALTLLNSMVTLDNVDHLSRVEVLDMQLFETAMSDSGVTADSVTARGLVGASGLPTLMRRLNR